MSRERGGVARGLWWGGNLLSRDLSEQGDGGGRLAIRASEVVPAEARVVWVVVDGQPPPLTFRAREGSTLDALLLRHSKHE